MFGLSGGASGTFFTGFRQSILKENYLLPRPPDVKPAHKI
jgi:hypothetical protein